MPNRISKFACITVFFLMVNAVGLKGQIVEERHSDVRFDPLAFEIPALTKSDKIIVYSGFTVSYNPKYLIPKWVAYELTSSEVGGAVPRGNGFCMDADYKGKQAMREDYSNSGWDKGHMAPAADMKWSRLAMNESFYLTNICPQDHTLNAQDWLTLEKLGREWAKKFGNVYIVCGPIVNEQQYGTIGAQNVMVPDAFFKAFLVVQGHSYHTIAFIMPNNSEHHRIQDYAMTVNKLEEIVALDIFTNIDDSVEEMVESDLYFKFWNL